MIKDFLFYYSYVLQIVSPIFQFYKYRYQVIISVVHHKSPQDNADIQCQIR